MVGATFIPPAGFSGEETVVLPPPPKVPVVEEVPSRAGAWVMAFQTFRTIPPPSRRK